MKAIRYSSRVRMSYCRIRKSRDALRFVERNWDIPSALEINFSVATKYSKKMPSHDSGFWLLEYKIWNGYDTCKVVLTK